MAVPIKFNFQQLVDLSEDIKKSPKALNVIVQRVLGAQLRTLAREMRPLVPRGVTGQLARSFGASVTRARGNVLAVFGFLSSRRITGRTIVAGNVLQKGGATPRKRQYLWIPLPGNRNVTPADFFSAQNTFIATSSAGNKIAFIRTGDSAIPLFVLKKNVKMGLPPLPIEERVISRLPEITGDIQESIAQIIEAKKAFLTSLSNE